MKQSSFSDLAYEHKKKTTRKERFLGEMDAILPWQELLKPILKKYPKAGQGRQPIPAAVMLRIYFLQQWYGLSDPGMADSLYDVESMRRFAGVDLESVPAESTILKFRHCLARHRLTAELFRLTRRYLSEQGLLLSAGTIVDASIINAPSSTKKRDRKRDTEMKQTKKGNAWYFGMKAPSGSDVQGRVHSVVVTHAVVHDSVVMADCLHGEEGVIYGDKAYADAARRQAALARGIDGRVSRKARRGKRLTLTRTGRLTGRVIGPAPGWNMPVAWSSIYGGIGRCVIGGWRRMRHRCLPCSPWPTSTWSGRHWQRHED